MQCIVGEPEGAIEVCCRLSSTVEDSEFAKNMPTFTVTGLKMQRIEVYSNCDYSVAQLTLGL